MSKKLTIVEQFAEIVASAKAGKVLTAEQIKFIEERAGKVADKNAKRKPTKVQTENEGIKSAIYEGMAENRAYTIGEIMKEIPECAELTNQKVSALVRQLKEDKLVERTEDKGKAYFTKVLVEVAED